MDRRALSRATEGTDAPTPGYLYVDLKRIISSNPTAAKDTATWLINRLQHKNHNVKYKSLNLITKLAAVPYFQRSITVDTEAIGVIKGHMNYSGPPDPLRGDEIYTRVRNICKECLDALYREPEPVNNHNTSSNMNSYSSDNTYGGISSESYRQGGAYNGHSHGHPSNSGSRMQGFGSHPDPRTQGGNGNPELSVQTVKKFASSLGEAVVGMIKDPLAKNVGAPNNNQSHIGNYRPNSYSNSSASASSYGNSGAGSSWNNPPGRTELAAATGGQWTMASNRGANAVRPPPSMGSWGQPASNVTSAPAALNTNGSHLQQSQQPQVSTQSSMQSDGSYERSIIGDLCPASGLYAVPDDGKLANFRGIVSGLNVDFICPPLLDLLESDLWQVKGKALHVINVLTSLDGELGQSYQDFFYECKAEIEPLAHHNKHAVRDPATKVLKKLGVVPASTTQKPQKPAAVEVEENLLELDSPDKIQRPAAANVSSLGSNDLFGGLTEKQSSEAAATEPQQKQQKQEESLLDSSSTTDIFSEMTLSDAPGKATQPEAVPASGFSFMNSSAPPAQATSEAPKANPLAPAPVTAPAKAEDCKSFDPLLSLAAPGSVPSAAPAMAMNPTAAYQVNPQMQIQMQMQMQMNPQMMNIQQQQQQQQAMYHMQPGRPVMMHGQGVGNYFNLDVPKPKKEDKSFDFVKDVVKSAK